MILVFKATQTDSLDILRRMVILLLYAEKNGEATILYIHHSVHTYTSDDASRF